MHCDKIFDFSVRRYIPRRYPSEDYSLVLEGQDYGLVSVFRLSQVGG